MRKLACACLLVGAMLVAGAQTRAPNFSGRWQLDVARSKIAATRPPVWGEDVIEFDGSNWHFQQVLRDATGRNDKMSVALKLGAHEDRVEKNGVQTVRSRMEREGGTLVLTEVITSSGKQKTTNTIRYSLTPDNDTLLVMEQEETPAGNQTNHWMFERELAQ